MLKEELLCNPREEDGIIIYEKPWVVNLDRYLDEYISYSCLIKGNCRGDNIVVIARAIELYDTSKIQAYKNKYYNVKGYKIMSGAVIPDVV